MNSIYRQWRAKRAIVQTARDVQIRTGKGVLSQLFEIAALRVGPGKLQARDYFTYGVYDDARYSWQEKREVLSWHPAKIADALNDPTWRAICDDKLVCYAFLRGIGVPFPEVYAAYSRRARTFGATPMLSSAGEVAAFLRKGMRYPFFGKRIGGGYGEGASFVRSLDRQRDCVTLATGEEVTVSDYVDAYVAPTRPGYLFQAPIQQHELIHHITGGRVGTLRLMVLLGDDGPRLFRVVWRVPVGNNITDNFRQGTQGNLVAQVDRDTGRVGTAIRVVQPAYSGEVTRHGIGTPVTTHPDTGEDISGVVLPRWDRVVSTCLHAAAALPGVRYQAWDVALGPQGPLVLELNYRGGFDIAQIPGTPGLFDAEFQEFWVDMHENLGSRTRATWRRRQPRHTPGAGAPQSWRTVRRSRRTGA